MILKDKKANIILAKTGSRLERRFSSSQLLSDNQEASGFGRAVLKPTPPVKKKVNSSKLKSPFDLNERKTGSIVHVMSKNSITTYISI